MKNKLVIIIVAVVCLVIGLIIGKNISSPRQRGEISNSSFRYTPSYTPSHSYTDDNAERVSELEDQREETRWRMQQARDKLEDARDAAEDKEWNSFRKWLDTGRFEDFMKKRDDEDQADRINDAIDELDDMESELDD
jgi:hypothetical protein